MDKILPARKITIYADKILPDKQQWRKLTDFTQPSHKQHILKVVLAALIPLQQEIIAVLVLIHNYNLRNHVCIPSCHAAKMWVEN